MRFSQKKFIGFSALVYSLFITIGCTSIAYRVHPNFNRPVEDLNSILLVTETEIYKFKGGKRTPQPLVLNKYRAHEPIEEWCTQSKKNIIRAVTKTMQEKNVRIKALPAQKKKSEELEDIRSLCRAVSASINLHAYHTLYTFPEKKTNFQYSIGTIEGILDRYDTEFLMYAYGFSQIPTGSKTVEDFIMFTLAGPDDVRLPMTMVNIALIDSSGTILWYSRKAKNVEMDLRMPDIVSGVIEDIFLDFPGVKK